MTPSRSFLGIPPHGARQRIGLFGGSFNPPHEGHRMASVTALRRCRLDAVWWLVTPGNPLKDTSHLPSLAARLESAAATASHPRILVTGIEGLLGSPYTADTVATLRLRCPGVHFVLLMGADSWVEFRRWKKWRVIARAVPIGIVDRPGSTLAAPRAQAAVVLAPFRLRERDAVCLASRRPPAYVFLHGRRISQSSTALRAHRRNDQSSS